ncbi:MAG: hypothetical protein LBQ40_05820 [Clostridiales bacterium]|jgi:hypothetical protein|nr:hypothetical protein [Clostridiales bacterium]
MFLNEICGKKIINSTTAVCEGVITGGVVSADLKSLAAFKAEARGLPGQSRGGGEIYIDPVCISSFNDALITKGLLEIGLPNGGEYIDAPIGAPVFNLNGLMYGCLVDICFNKAFRITKLVYDRPFGIQKIISVSKDAIVARAAAQKNRKPADRGLILRNGERARLVYSADCAEPKAPPAAAPALDRRAACRTKYPAKVVSGYTFLLGRTVGDDIRNAKNGIIIDRGTVITPETVEKAGVCGKLVELTFSSLKA